MKIEVQHYRSNTKKGVRYGARLVKNGKVTTTPGQLYKSRSGRMKWSRMMLEKYDGAILVHV